MKKKIILIVSMISVASTLFACNSSNLKKNTESSNEKVEKLTSSKIKINNKPDSNKFVINTSDNENIKLHKKAYNICYDLYKQGFVLRNYVLYVEEMCFDHGKNTVYEIIYNCVYKDMDIETPLESLKSEQTALYKQLNSVSENSSIEEYIKNFKLCYDKGEYTFIEKVLLSDMSCNDFMLGSYNKNLNLAIENQKRILDNMKKQLENKMK